MSNKLNLPYYNPEQSCKKLDVDPTQLKDIIKIYKAHLFISINKNDVVYKVKVNSITDDKFFRLSKLTIEEIISEGWIKTCEYQNTFILEKGTANIQIILDKGRIKSIQKLFDYSRKEKSNHAKHVELPENSPIIDELNNEKFEIKFIEIKSQEEGYQYILKKESPMTGKNIYMYHDEIERLVNTTYDSSQNYQPIKKVLEMTIISVIKQINPNYNGMIHNKTSAPHRLLIRAIAIMCNLGIKADEITWPNVHSWIDNNIYNNQELKSLTGLDEINEEGLSVSSHPITKRNCQNKISAYKRNIFNM